MRRALALITVWCALALFAAPARAQELQPTMERIAAAWHKGDANAITALAARAGISMDVDGTAAGPMRPPQAAAVLRSVFDDRESVGARASTSRATSAERAFGQISWTVRVDGTTIPQTMTIYVGLVREDAGWRVSEIRLMR